MSEIELIAAALAAGTLAGVTGAASNAVRDAYEGFRNLLRRRLADRPAAQEALDTEVHERDEWITRFGDELSAAGVDRDDEVLAAARRVLDEERRVDSGVTTYVYNNQGVVFGDKNPINMTFG